jgi:hypothetical protein
MRRYRAIQSRLEYQMICLDYQMISMVTNRDDMIR